MFLFRSSVIFLFTPEALFNGEGRFTEDVEKGFSKNKIKVGMGSATVFFSFLNGCSNC